MTGIGRSSAVLWECRLLQEAARGQSFGSCLEQEGALAYKALEELMKRRNLVPNAITTFGLSCGLFALFVNVLPGHFGVSPLPLCIGLVLLAALADLLDGLVARALRAETAFGCLFDSLADAIAFGVTPATVVLASLQPPNGTLGRMLAVAAAMLFAICGVLRLVRYNVQKASEQSEAERMQGMRHFTGLPIPAAALALLGLENFWQSSCLETLTPQLSASSEGHLLVIGVAEFLLSYLMVSRLKFPSAKLLHFRVKTFTLAALSAAASLALLVGLLQSVEVVLFALTWGYIILGLGLGLARQIAGRRSATLREFEPEEEEEIDG